MSADKFHCERLENDVVALVPYDPNIHTAPWVETMKADPDLTRYTPMPIFDNATDFNREIWEPKQTPSSQVRFYAIIDKLTATGSSDSPENFAGIVNFSHLSPVNASAEIGTMIFRPFQRTHVCANAVGLALMWALDPPSAGGVGLRRVEWKCHAENVASRKTALSLGFEFEGIARWHSLIRFPDRPGVPVGALEARNGTTGEKRGRHTAIYSLVWDEWEEKRPALVARMERRP